MHRNGDTNQMSILITKSAIPLKCQRCSKVWNYTGKNEWVATCPHCRTFVRIKKQRVDVNADTKDESVLGGLNSSNVEQRTTKNSIERESHG